MSELDRKTYSVFEIHPLATPKPSLTSRDHLHGRRQSRCCQVLTCPARTLYSSLAVAPYTKCRSARRALMPPPFFVGERIGIVDVFSSPRGT